MAKQLTLRELASESTLAQLLKTGVVLEQHLDRPAIDVRRSERSDYVLLDEIIVAIHRRAPVEAWVVGEASPHWEFVSRRRDGFGRIEYTRFGTLVLTRPAAPTFGGARNARVFTAEAVDQVGRRYELLWDPDLSPFVDDPLTMDPPYEFYLECAWDRPTQIKPLD